MSTVLGSGTTVGVTGATTSDKNPDVGRIFMGFSLAVVALSRYDPRVVPANNPRRREAVKPDQMEIVERHYR